MKNKVKKIIIICTLALIVLAFIVTIGLYLGNREFRMWADKHIFAKDIEESNLPAIDLDTNKNVYAYCYENNVVTLEDNNLVIYNKFAKKITNINVLVSNPKFQSDGNYLLIADEGASKIYLIYNNSLQWEKDVDGQISQITVNKNGAVGVIVTGTTYKSVIIMYDITGKESFKYFLSTTSATDLSISEDQSKLSFTEINTSGATITSKVKTISVEKAISNPKEPLENTYDFESNVLLLKINYRKNKVVAFTDNGVYLLNNGNKEKILELDNNISFVDINLNGFVASIKEDSNRFELYLTNAENKRANTYLINDAVKNIYCKDEITAVDLGNKLEFVSNNGWLIKKFTSHQNIKEVILGKNIAAIIYKDRIEILDL